MATIQVLHLDGKGEIFFCLQCIFSLLVPSHADDIMLLYNLTSSIVFFLSVSQKSIKQIGTGIISHHVSCAHMGTWEHLKGDNEVNVGIYPSKGPSLDSVSITAPIGAKRKLLQRSVMGIRTFRGPTFSTTAHIERDQINNQQSTFVLLSLLYITIASST